MVKKLIITVILTLLSLENAYAVIVRCPDGRTTIDCPVNQTCQFDGVGTPICVAPPPVGVSNEASQAVGSVYTPSGIGNTAGSFFGFIPTGHTLFLIIGVIAVLLYIAYGAVKWIMAGGDPKALASARGTITHAIIGFLLLSSGYAVMMLLWTALGFDKGMVAQADVKVYVCGWGASNQQEARNLCQTPITVNKNTFNSFSGDKKARLCYSPGECDQKCWQNHRYNPPEYRHCWRP